MKKLLTFAVAAVAASAMQAATVSWGGDTLNNANTAGYTGVGSETSVDYEGYAAAGTTYALILLGDSVTGTASTYDPATGLTDLGGTVVDTYTLDSDDADGGQFTGTYIASADAINGKYFMVTVYDPTTKTADFSTFQITGASDTGSAFDAASLTSGTLGNNMGSLTVKPVPEPTTVALLALGLVAAGLKRKVA